MSLAHPASETADAFVLAGGKSSRMGRDKALIDLAGKPLITYALDALRKTGFNPRIAGACGDLSQFAPVIPDRDSTSGLGPLSGICAALSASDADYAIFLPVDLSLVPAALITCLLHHSAVTESAVTVASAAGFFQTFPAVIHHAAFPTLEAALGSGDRNCLRAFRAASEALSKRFSAVPLELLIQAAQVSHPDGLPAYLWFHNINSLGALNVAEALISGWRTRQVR